MSFAAPLVAPRRQAGLSLIELMIAMLIGLVLILGLVQVFGASRQAYQLSQGIARNQENGRFAVDFLSRDLRMAGHTGCVNDQQLLTANAAGNPIGGNIRSLFLNQADRNSNNVAAAPFPLRFDVAIQGFDANGTEPEDTLAVSTTPGTAGSGDFSPALPADLAALNPIVGSDIVVLRYFSPEETKIQGFAPGATPAVTYPDESVAGSTRVATGGHGLYAVADCGGATVFQATAAPGNTGMNVDVAGKNLSGLDFVGTYDGAPAYSAGQASLFRAESVAYYVRLNNANPQTPSLYRAHWEAAPDGTLSAVEEELVEGVESLQLLYGQDAAPLTSMPSGYITQSKSAADLGDATQAAAWRRVGSVQIGLLVRGGSERAASEQAEIGQTGSLNVLAVDIDPPSDGHFRSVYETTVALRNRLFGN